MHKSQLRKRTFRRAPSDELEVARVRALHRTNRMRMLLHCLTLLGTMAAGCAPRAYVYEPVTTTSAEPGADAASSPIPPPPAAAQGRARLLSFGMADVKPENAPSCRAVAMRLDVMNDSGRAFRVDARVQGLVFDDGQIATPMYALATAGAPPVVEVPPGQSRAIDLFFPLPHGVRNARELPRFDAVWSVQTSEQVVTGRVPFARSAVAPRAYSDVEFPFWFDRLNPAVTSVTLVRLEGPYLHRSGTPVP